MAKKVIGISPDMYSLVKRISEQGNVTKQYIMKTPRTSRTIKSLLGHGFVVGVGSDSREYVLTDLGKQLASLTPRFSGETVRDGIPMEVWNVNLENGQVSN